MFKLMWKSIHGVEEIESGIKTRREAMLLRREYLIAFGFAGDVTIQREKEVRKL